VLRGSQGAAWWLRVIPHSRPWITLQDERAVGATLESEMIGQGEETGRLEAVVSRWMGISQPGVAVGSGSAALSLALAGLGVGDGDEVVIPTYVHRSVLDAVRGTGARPVIADIGPNWVMTPDSAEPFLTGRTAAIVVPHMYGIFADVAAFQQFGVPVIEDFAQAFGGFREWPLAGDIGVFSFHPAACLTTGEGGMVVARDLELNVLLRELRDGGCSVRRSFAPMSNLAAALGLSQLSRYRDALARRAAIAETYRQALGASAGSLLRRTPWDRTMHLGFPITLTGGLDAFGQDFADRGITVRRGVEELMHRVIGEPDAPYALSTELFHTTVSIPIYPALTDREVGVCAQALSAVCTHRKAA
jgi:UDP-4-amino-4-deoxy-L-arabinose-oxoglutarate aminotransferase